MNEKIIKDYIKEKLNKDAEVIERMMGGMSNYTYLISIDGDKYTFRVPGKGAEHFTNRLQEDEVMKMIESLNLIEKPIINDIENGYKVAPYIEGTCLSDIPEKPYKLLAATLKKLHNHDKFAVDYQPLQRLDKYQKLINDPDPVYLVLKNKWTEIYNKVLKEIELKPCHCDTQASNFVFGDNNKIYLLDWEFAANNDPVYDIACFGNLNTDEAISLLEAYYEESAGKNEYQRLYAWRMFQCLQWHTVARYKHEIGLSNDLSVDFGAVADAYLDRAKNYLQDYMDVSEE